MGYIEIIKQGFRVGNRNLFVLLTQFLSGIALVVIFIVFSVALAFTAIGALPKLDLQNFSGDTLVNLFQTSMTIVAIAVFLGLVFIIIAALITAYVHAGSLGCIIETAKGRISGFTFSTFFSAGNRSALSMLWQYFLWLFIVIGLFLVFGAVAGIGIWAVLMPLKEAGKSILAFGIGVPFFVVLILAAILAMFFIFAGWTFSALILVSEKTGAFSAIRASYRFIKNNFWDALLFCLIMLMVAIALNIPANLVSMPFSMKAETDPAGALFLLPLLVIGMVIQMYVGLIVRACFAVYYVSRTAPAPTQAAPVPSGPSPAQEDEIQEAELVEPEEGASPSQPSGF